MLGFRRMKPLQKFGSILANVHNHFNLERHLIDYQPTNNDAPPRWRSDKSLRARRLLSKPELHRVESGSH